MVTWDRQTAWVVESNHAHSRVVGDMLRDRFDVVSFLSASQAIEAMEEGRRADLVVASHDVRPSGSLNGLDVTICAKVTGARTILLPEDSYVDGIEQIGAEYQPNAVLQKPYVVMSFRRAIEGTH